MASVTTRRKTAARARMPRPSAPPTASEELSENQNPPEAALDALMVLEPPAAPIVAYEAVPVSLRRYVSLIPEWVPNLMEHTSKIQMVVAGIGLTFAAAATVVHRHEQRFHGAPQIDTPLDPVEDET